mgnify:CR=1 FL=1
MQHIKENIMIDVINEDTSIKEHFDNIWSTGKSPWKFSIGKIVSKKKELLIPIINKSESILDLGCGDGEFLNFVFDHKKKNINVWGVDIVEKAIKNAELLNIYDKLDVSNIDDIYVKASSKLDLILLNEVLYYQKDYIQTLTNLITISNKYIFISLAVGSDFFDKDDILIIKKIFSTHKFKLINETIIHYTKFKIPLKYFFMKKSSQTHKHILIFRKNGIE